jgi:hypothetical protein
MEIIQRSAVHQIRCALCFAHLPWRRHSDGPTESCAAMHNYQFASLGWRKRWALGHGDTADLALLASG